MQVALLATWLEIKSYPGANSRIYQPCDLVASLVTRFFIWWNMRKQMTFEEADRILLYDPESGLLKWKISRPKAKAGAIVGNIMTTSDGKKYLQFGALGTMYLVHRVAYLLMTGTYPPGEIDHLDGNGLNNRWTNLRAVTRLENARNHKIGRNNTSGCRGVRWHMNRWEAYIYDRGEFISVGRFVDKQAAIVARKKAEIELGYHPNHGSDRPL